MLCKWLSLSLSDNQPLTCGIPQGTILVSLLFLLYINDLLNCLVNAHPRMYADDTHLTLASNDVAHLEENMNDDLNKITSVYNMRASEACEACEADVRGMNKTCESCEA